jgi:cell division septal protein FtsQ
MCGTGKQERRRGVRKNRFNVGLIILSTIIFLALMFVIGYIWRSLGPLDYFQIKDIVTDGSGQVDLSYLKGRNIFSVDLKKESRHILEYYSDASSVRLVRLLPDRIFAGLVKRKAIASVKLYRYFSADADGVLFYPEQEQELPVIFGLETKIFGPKPGKPCHLKELELALNIIKEVNRNRVLKRYKIEKIDVTNPASISVFMPYLEVKLSAGNIKNKIAILEGLFVQEKESLANIKYIDLRFKEPVIKLVKPQLSAGQ